MAWYRCGGTPSEVLSLPTPSEASGAIARFNTDLTENLLSAVAEFSASQASGTPTPSAPIPIVGVDKVNVTRTGKNLCGGSKLLANAQAYLPSGTTDLSEKTFSFSSTASTTSGLSLTSGVKFKENTVYTFILTLSNSVGTGTNLRIYYTNGTYDTLRDIDGTNKQTKVYTSNGNKTVEAIRKYSGNGTTTIYYDESGVFEGDITALDFEPYNGTTALINLGGTYYGGSVDAVTGKITLTWFAKTLSDVSVAKDTTCQHTYRCVGLDRKYANQNFNIKSDELVTYTQGHSTGNNISSLEVGNDWTIFINADSATFFITADSNYNNIDAATFKSNFSSLLLVYELATPIVVYASNTAEIPTIVGDNQVFADTGDVAVKFLETVGHKI